MSGHRETDIGRFGLCRDNPWLPSGGILRVIDNVGDHDGNNPKTKRTLASPGASAGYEAPL